MAIRNSALRGVRRERILDKNAASKGPANDMESSTTGYGFVPENLENSLEANNNKRKENHHNKKRG